MMQAILLTFVSGMHYICGSISKGAQMPKSESLTIRLDPAVREVLRLSAERERRSVSNMVEVMILTYGKGLGIEEDQVRPISKGSKKAKAERNAR